ncbi:hypothetical protein H4R18_002005 [Coemansia javaensis]|uniref:NADH:flavin oxidoreductase/NADH oxidase N-terminal domain-containing protein n=1 Tax=Coemansia javaensis TaxID=2761396 RepID=A0A9W8LKQ1_9FUNG|nr:hypothetical protein H4R18_002005 [Coemansia javaensis]
MASSSDPQAFYHEQRARGPGAAVAPTASEVRQGFASEDAQTAAVPALYQPLTVRGVTLKNRIALSPMCMYSSQDGFATDFHLVHVGQYAVRGVGLVVMEAAGVAPEGRITPHCLGLWKDAHVAKLRQIVAFAHAHKAAAGIQLAHAGRKASTTAPWLIKVHGANADAAHGGWPGGVCGPSPLPFSDASWAPHELDAAAIRRIQREFADAARRADAAGFDVLELHGAHGYLLHQFLSPISNARTDEYGGSFDNRIRFVVETVRAVRAVWPPEKPLFVRLSMTDWVAAPAPGAPAGGWTEEEAIELARVLSREGVDLVDCSSSGSSPLQSIPLAPGYQVPFAAALKAQVPGLLAGAVGLITSAAQANAVLAEQRADLVFMGRALLRDPNLALDAAAQLGAFAQYPHQYERGRAKTRLTFV